MLINCDKVISDLETIITDGLKFVFWRTETDIVIPNKILKAFKKDDPNLTKQNEFKTTANAYVEANKDKWETYLKKYKKKSLGGKAHSFKILNGVILPP